MDPMKALHELKAMAEQANMPLAGHVHASKCFTAIRAALTPKPEVAEGPALLE
jgi:hypothetical protein